MHFCSKQLRWWQYAVSNTHVACLIAELFLSFSDISNISNQAVFIPVVAFRAAVDKEMAGSRYDSDFLFLSTSWGHPSYLYHKGVCHPRHTDDSGMAQSHKLIFLPSRFLSSLMPHTLSLFICLHHHANTHRKSKRERRDICMSGQGFVEKVQPQRKPSDRQDGDRGAATRHHTAEFSVSGALRA